MQSEATHVGQLHRDRRGSADEALAERIAAHLTQWCTLPTGSRSRLSKLPSVIRVTTSLKFYHPAV